MDEAKKDDSENSQDHQVNESGPAKRRRSLSPEEIEDDEHEETEEEREERKAKNRLSAHKSRMRKRMQLQELQEKVANLMDDMSKVNALNRKLSTELEATRQENLQLRLMLATKQQQQQQSPRFGAMTGTADSMRLQLLLQQQQQQQQHRLALGLAANPFNPAMASILSNNDGALGVLGGSAASEDSGNGISPPGPMRSGG